MSCFLSESVEIDIEDAVSRLNERDQKRVIGRIAALGYEMPVDKLIYMLDQLRQAAIERDLQYFDIIVERIKSLAAE